MKSKKHANLKVSWRTKTRHTVWCVNIKIAHEKAGKKLAITVRLTDGREFGNVHSLAEVEFTLKNEHHVYRLTRLLQNHCWLLVGWNQ
nr:hypothetical protein [uncultured Flavobacterium sp.]